jgi:hypothetical protein
MGGGARERDGFAAWTLRDQRGHGEGGVAMKRKAATAPKFFGLCADLPTINTC